MDDPFGEFIDDLPEWRRDNFTDFVRLQQLGVQLWGAGGSKDGTLQRQLELPSPEIPATADRRDLLALEKYARMVLESANHRWAPQYLTNIVTVGANKFTIAEAMYEIVRRALIRGIS